jgi:hypothetical protein
MTEESTGANGTTVFRVKLTDGETEETHEIHIGPDFMRTAFELIDRLSQEIGTILGVPVNGESLPSVVKPSTRCDLSTRPSAVRLDLRAAIYCAQRRTEKPARRLRDHGRAGCLRTNRSDGGPSETVRGEKLIARESPNGEQSS